MQGQDHSGSSQGDLPELDPEEVEGTEFAEADEVPDLSPLDDDEWPLDDTSYEDYVTHLASSSGASRKDVEAVLRRIDASTPDDVFVPGEETSVDFDPPDFEAALREAGAEAAISAFLTKDLEQLAARESAHLAAGSNLLPLLSPASMGSALAAGLEILEANRDELTTLGETTTAHNSPLWLQRLICDNISLYQSDADVPIPLESDSGADPLYRSRKALWHAKVDLLSGLISTLRDGAPEEAASVFLRAATANISDVCMELIRSFDNELPAPFPFRGTREATPPGQPFSQSLAPLALLASDCGWMLSDPHARHAAVQRQRLVAPLQGSYYEEMRDSQRLAQVDEFLDTLQHALAARNTHWEATSKSLLSALEAQLRREFTVTARPGEEAALRDAIVAARHDVELLGLHASPARLRTQPKKGKPGEGGLPLREVPLPEGTRWHDITLRHDRPDSVVIRVGGLRARTFRASYVDLGFQDGRTKSPSQLWELLSSLIEANSRDSGPPGLYGRNTTSEGLVSRGSELISRGRGSEYQRIRRIRRALKLYFPTLEGDPLPRKRGLGWQPAFNCEV